MARQGGKARVRVVHRCETRPRDRSAYPAYYDGICGSVMPSKKSTCLPHLFRLIIFLNHIMVIKPLLSSKTGANQLLFSGLGSGFYKWECGTHVL